MLRASTLVELHADVKPGHFSFFLDLDPFFNPQAEDSRWQKVVLLGRPVPTLAPEDLLLLLCAHGAKHLWQDLRWVCDIAELLRGQPGLDWRRVCEEARALHGERMLLLGLALAERLLDAPVLEGLGRRARAEPVVRSLVAQTVGRMFGPASGWRRAWEELAFPVRVRERRRDAFRFYFRRAVTPTTEDWAAWRLPPALAFVYPLLRPWRLALKYGRRLLFRRQRSEVRSQKSERAGDF
jgi:hypothetical protein